jgi:hypothetical protein
VFPGRNRVAVGASVALALTFVAAVRVEWSGRDFGLYLVRSTSGRPLALKDDLRVSDLPRYLGGVTFPRQGSRPRAGDRAPHLDVQWDAVDGSGFVTNRLADGRVLETVFGRYQEDDDSEPHGLFVGGAVPEVVARFGFDESGMSVLDERGWHHLWCTVNEAWLLRPRGRYLYPSDWRLVRSAVVSSTPEQVVLESEHRYSEGSVTLGMLRRARFRAGQPVFRLEVAVVNLGDEPVTFTYGYGDEPWVGRYGTAAGNIGWLREGPVGIAGLFDPHEERWAGIYDRKSGVANLIAWPGDAPDVAYFGNHAGTPRAAEVGAPLASNEVYVGLEWRHRTIGPGRSQVVQLDLGLASVLPNGRPAHPADAAAR